jgi:predicted component of type VI protein secretion system
MSAEHLRRMLENLHAELQSAESVDDRSRELLREVDADIQELLERSDGQGNESLTERLREFEERHPALTEAVGRVLDALAKMGI